MSFYSIQVNHHWEEEREEGEAEAGEAEEGEAEEGKAEKDHTLQEGEVGGVNERGEEGEEEGSGM